MATVVVAGLGAAGAAAAWRLASAGHRVIGLDPWQPPHPYGSSHGDTRVTRTTAWEGAEYVPLAARAHELWDQLEHRGGQGLRERRGVLFVGRAEETIIAGTRSAGVASGVAARELSAHDVAAAVPGLTLPEGGEVLLDEGGGVLLLDRCLTAMLDAAAAAGADLRSGTRLLRWDASGSGVAVYTDSGAIGADALILAMGGWMVPELAGVGIEAFVERQTMHWFASRHAADADRPVLIVSDGADHATVIFPARDGLVKVAGHGSDAVVATPDLVDRAIHDADIAAVHETLERWLPGRHGAHRRAATCLYTRTPSGGFLIDRHPLYPSVVLASPCNGFGFKFAPAVGELLASLALGEDPPRWSPRWRLPPRR